MADTFFNPAPEDMHENLFPVFGGVLAVLAVLVIRARHVYCPILPEPLVLASHWPRRGVDFCDLFQVLLL